MAGKHLAAGVLGACLLSTTAFAAIHNLGDLTPTATAGATDVDVTTVDLIGTFTSSTPFDVSGSTTTAVTTEIISGATLDLYSGTPTGTNTLLVSVPVPKLGSAYFASLSDNRLAAGSYFLAVVDTASGPVSPAISVSTGASIPEASKWAMMLLGFAGLGFAGYRTSRKAVLIVG
jgi:hypothetical protein